MRNRTDANSTMQESRLVLCCFVTMMFISGEAIMCNFRSPMMTIFDACNPILAYIHDILYRASIPIPMGVIPDIFNRESILDLYRWIPPHTAGMTNESVTCKVFLAARLSSSVHGESFDE